MEKCGNKSKPKSCRRLLVFILLIFIIMSKTHSQSQNNEIENFDFFYNKQGELDKLSLRKRIKILARYFIYGRNK